MIPDFLRKKLEEDEEVSVEISRSNGLWYVLVYDCAYDLHDPRWATSAPTSEEAMNQLYKMLNEPA